MAPINKKKFSNFLAGVPPNESNFNNINTPPNVLGFE
jgi:hypothetical protein